jgi:hypothetical protein
MKREKINQIQGYNLSHEDIACKMDDLEFWKKAAEESYLDIKFHTMRKPSRTEGKYRKAIPCDITKEEFLNIYKSHKQRMKRKFPESDGRLCRYCEKRLTYMVGYKNTNASVDRLQNELGYEKNNVVICCGTCNDTKNRVTVELCENILRVKNEME